MTAAVEVAAVLTMLADACWASDTAVMPAAFLAACETYGVNPGRCDECGEHEHDPYCVKGLCDCGQPPLMCTCDALYDERMGK
jgi:hypothetical protein